MEKCEATKPFCELEYFENCKVKCKHHFQRDSERICKSKIDSHQLLTYSYLPQSGIICMLNKENLHDKPAGFSDYL